MWGVCMVDVKIKKETKKQNKNNSVYTSLDESDKQLLILLEKSTKKLHFLYKQFIFNFGIASIFYIISFFLYVKFKDNFSTLAVVILIFAILIPTITLVFSSFLAIVRFYWDRHKIKGYFIEKFSNRYVVGNWIDSTRRIFTKICIVKDDREIYYDKGLYLVDHRKIYYDEKKRPNLIFNKRSAEAVDINKDTSLNEDSTRLREYKNANFVKEIMKESGGLGNNNMIFIILGVIILLILIFIAIKLGDGTTVSSVVYRNLSSR